MTDFGSCRLPFCFLNTKKMPLFGQPVVGRDKGRDRPKVCHTGQRGRWKGGRNFFSAKLASGGKTEEFFPPDVVKIHAAKNRQTQEVENLGKRGKT